MNASSAACLAAPTSGWSLEEEEADCNTVPAANSSTGVLDRERLERLDLDLAE